MNSMHDAEICRARYEAADAAAAFTIWRNTFTGSYDVTYAGRKPAWRPAAEWVEMA